MADYHVGCGLFGIYAGTLKKNGEEWRNKSEVTNEAINAVVQHMYWKVPEGEDSFAYGFKMRDGKYVRLMVEVADKCPEWAKEQLEGEKKDGDVL